VPAALPGVKSQTIRMIARVSIGGDTVRVRLAHAFGAAAVSVGEARIAIRAKGSAIETGTDRPLTFGGRTSIKIHGGQVVVSDPVMLMVRPMTDVAVSVYFPDETGPPTSHTFGLRPTYVSTEGNFTSAPDIASVASTMESYYWLAGIDVLAPPDAGTLVTFGDSITDGDQSTPDTNGMWPAVLAARLQANRPTRHVAVVNAGISGNRVLGDNNSGLVRLVSHALSVPGARWITVLEGINDIAAATRPGSTAPPLAADDLIAAYRQMIEMAHTYGLRVIGCTITPYGESSAYSDRGEGIRRAVNEWIRTSRSFDAVVDFDAVTRDPTQPTRFRPEADSPDMLHPGNGGYRLMAESIDLSMFTTPIARRR
jgi:lysophospholipase L1-like esterase